MTNSIKAMLFGIALMILGIYIQGDSDNAWHELEFILVIFGLVIVIIGVLWGTIKKIIDK